MSKSVFSTYNIFSITLDTCKSEKEFNSTLKNYYAFKKLLGIEENKIILQDFLECMFDFPAEAFEELKLLD